MFKKQSQKIGVPNSFPILKAVWKLRVEFTKKCITTVSERKRIVFLDKKKKKKNSAWMNTPPWLCNDANFTLEELYLFCPFTLEWQRRRMFMLVDNRPPEVPYRISGGSLFQQ